MKKTLPASPRQSRSLCHNRLPCPGSTVDPSLVLAGQRRERHIEGLDVEFLCELELAAERLKVVRRSLPGDFIPAAFIMQSPSERYSSAARQYVAKLQGRWVFLKTFIILVSRVLVSRASRAFVPEGGRLPAT